MGRLALSNDPEVRLDTTSTNALYERGGHGFGTNEHGLLMDSWPDRWFDWPTSHGML